MNIKQQLEIKSFLIREFGERKGLVYFGEQAKYLEIKIKDLKGMSKSQFKMLTQTILPRIALYHSLSTLQTDKRSEVMRRYMIDEVGGKKHTSTAKMEKFPGFFYIYRSVFLKIMRTTDLQKSTQVRGKNYYDITITECLWHRACVEYGCPELCELFCDVDDATYGGLNKIGFSRTKTLGYGGDCCDFHFFKK